MSPLSRSPDPATCRRREVSTSRRECLRLQHPGGRGHRPGPPMRVTARRILQRLLDDHLVHPLIRDHPRSARPRLLGRPFRSPLRHGVARDPHRRSHLTDRAALAEAQHNPRPQRRCPHRLAPTTYLDLFGILEPRISAALRSLAATQAAYTRKARMCVLMPNRRAIFL